MSDQELYDETSEESSFSQSLEFDGLGELEGEIINITLHLSSFTKRYLHASQTILEVQEIPDFDHLVMETIGILAVLMVYEQPVDWDSPGQRIQVYNRLLRAVFGDWSQ